MAYAKNISKGFLTLVMGVACSGVCANDLSALFARESCREAIVDHGGTIDSSCQSRGFAIGCYDVVETTCTEGGNVTRKFREKEMNGKCGHSYSDCW